MAMTDEQLAKALIQEGLIDLQQVQSAAKQRGPGKTLRDVLVEQGMVTAADMNRIDPEGARKRPASVDLRSQRIDPEAVQYLPRDRAVTFRCIPISIEGNVLTVAMENPADLPTLDQLQSLTRMRINAVPATVEQIMQAINSFYGSGQLARAQDIAEAASDDFVRDMDDVQELTEEGPIIRIVDMIMREGLRDHASDIHVEPREDGLYLRMRVDGLLRPPNRLENSMKAGIISRLKLMAGLNIAENRLPQDGRFPFNMGKTRVDVRVSTLPTYHGEKVVMRILDRSSLKVNLSDLGFHPQVGALFDDLCLKPQGMILVTGPTGSGKSTTLYAALNRAKSETKNVVTVEDPIEYQLEGINQTQVNPKINLNFAVQLRAILRQDPDVILVGEIRDRETADMAFRAALTGHLVLSTLHTNDASSAPVRLIDMGVEPYLIAASVIAVLGQKLVRTICPNCREQHRPSQIDLDRIGMSRQEAESITFYHGVGCPACGHTGFAGRTGIYELLTMSEPVRQGITQGLTASELRQLCIRHKMRTMRDDGLDKIRTGQTTPDELARVLFAFMDLEEPESPAIEEEPPLPADETAPTV